MRPTLFEPHLLAARRNRGEVLGFTADASFLHKAVGDSLRDRLASVTRDFADWTLIGAGNGTLAKMLPKGVTPRVLERSAARAANLGLAPTAWTDALPLPISSQDLILSLLELHWSDDPVGQLIQMRRALRPDGLVLAALFGGQTLHELRTALAEAEVALTGGLSPRVAPMAELRDLGALLQRAGFALPVADTEKLEVTYPDIWALMRDLRCMGETNILAARRRGMTPRRLFEEADRIYRHAFPAEGGRLRATFEIIYLTGWAPAENQPRPLRPGSARMRLSDALGTTEKSAGERAGFPVPNAAGDRKPNQD
ncbi:MAG: methyltransferase domain-containing protein [Pseudomonadota bacterium]